jgi:hypothetical protein
MTLEDASGRAAVFDEKIASEIAKNIPGNSTDLFIEIRAYLIRRADEMDVRNNPMKLAKLVREVDTALILLGPTFDKGPTPDHFHFDSGARLSFSLTVRDSHGSLELISFRFQYQRQDNRVPEYFRFDLNHAGHENPLMEPRCHVHPGLEDVRLPFTLLNPIEILDRIFFVLDRYA